MSSADPHRPGNQPALLALVLLSGFFPVVAPAQVTTYTDRAAWLAAAGSVTNIDFEGIAPSGGAASYNTAAGLTLSGVQFLGPFRLLGTGSNLVIVSGADAFVAAWGPGDKLMGGEVEIDANLPPGITAVGVDIMVTFTFGGGTSSYTATLSNGQVFTGPTFPPPTRALFGFVSPTPITSLKIVTGGTFPMIDNFSFHSAAPVPAVSAPGAIAAGASLLGMGVLLLRKTWATP